MSGYKWRAAAAQLVERVRIFGPRVALVGAVMLAVVAVPLILRYWVHLPR